MRFAWTYSGPGEELQHFLRQQGLSRAQLKKLHYHGGFVFVNQRERHSRFLLHTGDQVLIQLAPEIPADTVKPFPAPIQVVYEDPHYLIVNKPAGSASIPDAAKGDDSMANRVKAYLAETHAESTAIHVVTRLDRDTSGLMLFAKHSFAHSLIDRQLHSPLMQKTYLAVISGNRPLPPHGWLILPVGRTQEFYMKRGVVPGGKHAVTEYWQLSHNAQGALVRVRLHTGRTHQIRVHFAAIGHPLYGDDLYGGPLVGIERQALHCAGLSFWHPFLQKQIEVAAPLPPDMTALVHQLQLTNH